MAAIVLTSTEGFSREEWLAFRNRGIGGSDAAVVCGVNKYKSPVQLWMEKTCQLPPEEAGEAAYWGTRMESLIREEFTLRTGIKVLPVNKILRSKDYPFMLANLDGVCRCPIHGKCVFEAKTASTFKAGEWEGDKIPYEYYLQVQHYLCVTGFNGAYISALIGGNAFQWKFIKRDEESISMLIKYERDFWMLVQDDVPPPIDGSDACVEFINQKYKCSIPQSKIKLPDSAADLIRLHNVADIQLEIFKEKKQRAVNALKQMLGEHEIGIIGDGYVKWQNVTKNHFNSELLKTEQPNIYSMYAEKSSHRRFTIKSAAKAS
jgi:putative phage-type endonuclease